MLKHTEKVHKSTNECHSCDICGEGFARFGHLQHHKYKVHNLEKSIQCDNCTKVFKQKLLLDKHKAKVHNSGKECFSCDLCGEAFSRNGYLQSHKAKEHNLTNPNPKLKSTNKLMKSQGNKFSFSESVTEVTGAIGSVVPTIEENQEMLT